LQAELQGLTGEAPPKPKTTPAPAPAPVVPPPQAPQAPQAKPKPPVPIPTPKPTPAPPAAAPSTAKPTPSLANKVSSQPNPALAGLGLDLDGIMDDGDDDDEVELTEDDWNDPHFMVIILHVFPSCAFSDVDFVSTLQIVSTPIFWWQDRCKKPSCAAESVDANRTSIYRNSTVSCPDTNLA